MKSCTCKGIQDLDQVTRIDLDQWIREVDGTKVTYTKIAKVLRLHPEITHAIMKRHRRVCLKSESEVKNNE